MPLLAAALPLIGHEAIRSRGTLGGSMAHADPAAELPAVARALDAEFVVRSQSGERVIPAAGWFEGYLTTARRPDEILVEMRFPVAEPGTGVAFLEIARRHGDFAMVGLATVGRGNIVEVRDFARIERQPHAVLVAHGCRIRIKIAEIDQWFVWVGAPGRADFRIGNRIALFVEINFDRRILFQEFARGRNGIAVQLQPVVLVHEVCDIGFLDALGLEFNQRIEDLSRDGVHLALGEKDFAQGRFDVLNTHSGRDSLLGGAAARLSGTPLIVRTRHLALAITSRATYTWLPHKVVAVSQSVMRYLVSAGVPEKDIVTIYTGIVKPQPVSRASSTLRAELGLGENAVIAGTVAIMRDKKGHPDLIRVANRREPVSDRDRRAALRKPLELGLDRRLGLRVERARRLVEHQHRRVS